MARSLILLSRDYTNINFTMLKQSILTLFAVASVAACSESSQTISFRSGDHYFVRNDVEEVPVIINSEAERDSTLGMATTMFGGSPTLVDFANESLVPVALPVTDISTEINIKSLAVVKDTLVVSCRVDRGDKMSYSIRPFALAIVKKADIANVKGVRVDEVE